MVRICLDFYLAGGFESFDGIASRRNKIGLLIPHSVIDSAALAIDYDTNPNQKLSNLAREQTKYRSYRIAAGGAIRYIAIRPSEPKANGEGNAKCPNGGKGERNNTNLPYEVDNASPNAYSIGASASSNHPPRRKVKKNTKPHSLV